MDVLIIYQFCTFGGVERVFLNRAKTFKKLNFDIKMTVGYLTDGGALDSFKTYVLDQNLEDFLSVTICDNYSISDIDQYEYVFVVDTPQVFNQIQKLNNVFIECHTHYKKNRQYLNNCPENILGIIVPSKSFRDLLISEFKDLPTVFVLPNPIPLDFFEIPRISKNNFFAKRPLTYFGRLDQLKNIDEALNLFDLISNNEEIIFFIIGHNATNDEMMLNLNEINLLRRTLIRDNLAFDQVPNLINLVKQLEGILISPSKGESFGLSVAEFLCGGVPVLLSDINAHRELVENDERYLYTLGDLHSAKQKLNYLLNHWEEMSKQVLKFSEKLNDSKFIEAWEKLISAK